MLFIGSDVNLKLSGVSDAVDGSYLNSGTCTYTITDSAGATVTSGSLNYVAASNGNYLGVIASTVTAGLVDGAQYMITITFTQATGNYDDERVITDFAGYRGLT